MLVHGWNMQGFEKRAYGDTTFKRMYWSGYKGQVGIYDWPTQSVENPAGDAGNFERSEFIAWNSAVGLRKGEERRNAPALRARGLRQATAWDQGGIVDDGSQRDLSFATFWGVGTQGGAEVAFEH